MLILCSVYAIIIVSEIFEYLGSGLNVPTEINGFLLSIDASLYKKQKTRKSNFMLILCSGYAIMLVSEFFEYLVSRLKVPNEINGFLLSIDASLYKKQKTRKSNFMLILCSGYAIMLVSEFFEYLVSRLKVPNEINGFLLSIDASLYQK